MIAGNQFLERPEAGGDQRPWFVMATGNIVGRYAAAENFHASTTDRIALAEAEAIMGELIRPVHEAPR